LKRLRTDYLISGLAKNLENNFQIKKTKISAHIQSLLKGIVHHSTITNHLDKQYKRNNHPKTKCTKCGKAVKSIVLHNARSHKK